MVCESETLSGIQPPSPFDRPDQDCFQTIAGFILYTDAWSSNDQWFKMINWNRWCTSNSDTRIQVEMRREGDRQNEHAQDTQVKVE